MTEEEFLRRIDEHLARADEHMARGNEIMARSDQTMARSDETMAESSRIHSGLRGFIREMTVRQERMTDRLVRQIDIGSARIEAGMTSMNELMTELMSELRGLNASTQLHTQALARILDRMA